MTKFLLTLITRFRQAKNRFNPETNVAHLCRVLEDTISVMERRKARLANVASQIPRKLEGDVQIPGTDMPAPAAGAVSLADRIVDGRYDNTDVCFRLCVMYLMNFCVLSVYFCCVCACVAFRSFACDTLYESSSFV